MRTSSNNKTIAKNTLFLYFRMMFTMIISLFTSRVILQTLGVTDYGIYQSVGGVVSMLSFINGALSTGSSRFLTFEMGTGNYEKLKRTFSSVLTVHILLALFVVLIAESGGLWFLYNKLVIPDARMEAAVFAYHLSILAAFFSITQVPYTACIISHERMSVYAYMSIIEVSLKLVIVYMLTVCSWDKLKFYSLLFCCINIAISLFYRFYCTRKFSETHFKLMWDKIIMNKILGYSGWNLFANISIALNNHGATLLINMFFHPGIVAARAIANQVNMSAYHFISNFRTAANPQIVKRYAAGDLIGSKKLLLTSTLLSYFLMLILALPICLVAEPLLHLWLGQIPEYSVSFLQLTIVTSLVQVFDTSFYTALYAKGRIRENALISPSIGFLLFPIVYVMFRLGASPLALSWGLLVLYSILGLLVKPILIIKFAGYTWTDILYVFRTCFRVTIVGIIIPIIFYIFRSELFPELKFQFIILVSISVFSVAFAVWTVGLDADMKSNLISVIKKKLQR